MYIIKIFGLDFEANIVIASQKLQHTTIINQYFRFTQRLLPIYFVNCRICPFKTMGEVIVHKVVDSVERKKSYYVSVFLNLAQHGPLARIFQLFQYNFLFYKCSRQAPKWSQKSHKIFPKSDFNLYEGQHQYNILSFVRSRQDNSREC